jgi:hypothetical protein
MNVTDGKLFIKTTNDDIRSFSNDSQVPYTLDKTLSSVEFQYGNNSITQSFGAVLGGYNNDISGAGSTVINGEDNDIAGDFALIGGGYKNKITSAGDYSAILAGSNNLISHENSFAIGSNLSSHSANFVYVNNLSAENAIYGDGEGITNLNATNLKSGTIDAARLPIFNGDITADTSAGSVSATVVAIQGEPISTQTPNIGQVLQWTGTAWTPGAITTGGSGGGGLVYYLNFENQAQAPTTNLPSTPHTPRELGAEGTIASSSVTKNNVSTTGYDLICGFVSLTGSPGSVTIPAGLWDFNIWASATSTTTNQTSLLLNVYKYDGSNTPTLIASSGDIFVYDPITTAQYIGSVVFPPTTLLETDRIYIELTAKATQHNKNITIYFGGTTPTHVHTTFPSVRGSGLVKVINGVYQSPASLLVNTDVAANAAIDQSKINGLTDVADKANLVFTTVQTNSANWESVYTTFKTTSADFAVGTITDYLPLSGGTISGSLHVTQTLSSASTVYSQEFAYNSTERPDLTGVKQALDELLYTLPAFNSLTVNGGNTLEVGQSISTPTISWTTNKTFNSFTLTFPNGTTSSGNGSFLSTGDPSSYTFSSSTGSKTWSVQGSDWKSATANRSTTVNWYYKVYMGAFNTTTPSSSDVLTNTQHSSLGSTRTTLGSKSITLSNEYFYVAYPAAFGVTSQLKVNGLNFTDIASVYTITPFTNSSGGTASYYVYRTNNKLTGTYTMEVL